MAKVVVTGGCGFIGSHVVDILLKHEHEVVVLDNFSTGRRENLKHCSPRVEIIECDIASPGEWQRHFCDAKWVVHLAALADIVPSIKVPESYFISNVQGTLNVLQAARESSLDKFVYAASSSCYGIPDNFPTSEKEELRPQYPYALTKKMGEDLVMHWQQVYKVPTLSLRFFNVYGPRSRTSGTYGAVFGVFLAQKLAKKPYTVVGDGEQRRDFTYVTDVARAVYASLNSDKEGQIYNVGSGNTVSVNKIVDLLGGEKIHIPKRPGEPDCTFADISKIVHDIDWKPTVNIERGITFLLEKIDYWKEAPVWDQDAIAEQTKEWFNCLS